MGSREPGDPLGPSWIASGLEAEEKPQLKIVVKMHISLCLISFFRDKEVGTFLGPKTV